MAVRGTTILQLLLVVALLYHQAAALVPSTVKHGSGSEAKSRAQVIASDEVPKGTTPWMVSIQTTAYTTRMHVCGGVILDYDWIMTTAFCASGVAIDHLWVVAGDHNITDNDGDEIFRNVKAIFTHPEYDYFKHENDIALLQLGDMLRKSDNVEPISFLRNPGSYGKETCRIVGWGVTDLDGFISSDVLMGANQTVFEEKDCKAVLPGLITDDMLCATDRRSGAGPCLGDWGGPLVCRGKELCGLASWGVGCGSKSMPAVYTNATYFYDWVIDIVEPSGETSEPQKEKYSVELHGHDEL